MSGDYRPGKAWFITALLAIFMLINFVDKIVIGLVAVPMMTELKLSPTEFGVVAASFFWLYAIAGVIGGFISNRASAKWLLLAMAVVWSAAQVPIAVSSSITIIVVARVLLGIGEGPAYPVVAHACYKWFPNDRRNLPVTSINLGSTFGLLIAGALIPLISARWGWRANFLALGAVGVVWAAIWLAFGADGSIDDSEPGSATLTTVAPRAPYGQLLTDPTVIGVIVLHFVAFWGLALTLTWLPAYFQKGLGYSAIDSGRMFALVVLLSAPISLGASWWSQRMLKRGASSRSGRAVLCAILLIAGGGLFFLLSSFGFSPFQKAIIVAVASGLTPVIYSLGPAMMAEVTPISQRGGMIAIENSVASLAGVFAPVVTGRLVEFTGTSAVQGYEKGFLVSGALLIAGGIIGLVLTNPEKSISRRAIHPNPTNLATTELGAR